MHKIKARLILFCILASSTLGQDFLVTPVEKSAGLYYEQVGEVLLSNHKWTFVTSVDYKGYLLFYDYIVKKADEVRTLCQTLNSNVCTEGFKTIETSLAAIDERDESMANFLGITTKNRRVKRFWYELGSFLGGLGGALINSLVNGADQDMSENSKAIDQLLSAQKNLENQMALQRTLFVIDSEKKGVQIKSLMNSQTEIRNEIASLKNATQQDSEEKEKQIKQLQKNLENIENQIKAQNSKIANIESNLLNVNKNMAEIKDVISNQTKDIQNLQIISKLSRSLENFKWLMNEFSENQKTLFEVIKDANSDQLDPYILTPSHLVQMLLDIQEHLPEGTKFPHYPNLENIKKIYRIIKTSVALYDYKIIFALTIPLVYSKTFSLHKMTSLPTTVGDNRFIFILPEKPFLMIDNDYQDYFFESSEYLNDCTRLEESKYMCKQIQEVTHSYHFENCEVKLFKSSKQTPDTCKKRIMILDRPIFLQLQRANSWIYAVPGTENLNVDCKRKRSITSLSGSGFLHLNNDCVARMFGFKLSSFDNLSKPVSSNFSPPLNLMDSVELSDFEDLEVKGSTTLNLQVISPFDLKKLEDISYGTEEITSSNGAHYIITFVVIIILMTVIVLVYLVHVKRLDFGELCNLINNVLNRNQELPAVMSQQKSDSENFKMKINVHPSNVRQVSVCGTPNDSDPDSEYWTVRLKVKKDKNEFENGQNSKFQKSKINKGINNVKPEPTEYLYLEQLRKLKPQRNYE